ncbi:MAG: hypothetical protein OEW08_01215 [Gammaproteobacteria bacterium]|nr:hypothetical protein [Gammaproteobacteria bacterium]
MSDFLQRLVTRHFSAAASVSPNAGTYYSSGAEMSASAGAESEESAAQMTGEPIQTNHESLRDGTESAAVEFSKVEADSGGSRRFSVDPFFQYARSNAADSGGRAADSMAVAHPSGEIENSVPDQAVPRWSSASASVQKTESPMLDVSLQQRAAISLPDLSSSARQDPFQRDTFAPTSTLASRREYSAGDVRTEGSARMAEVHQTGIEIHNEPVKGAASRSFTVMAPIVKNAHNRSSVSTALPQNDSAGDRSHGIDERVLPSQISPVSAEKTLVPDAFLQPENRLINAARADHTNNMLAHGTRVAPSTSPDTAFLASAAPIRAEKKQHYTAPPGEPVVPQDDINAMPPSKTAGPRISISIGTIEIRAAPTAPQPTPRMAPQGGPRLTLDEYMRRRNGGGAV